MLPENGKISETPETDALTGSVNARLNLVMS
jgi:hypothetical protein